MGGERDTSAGGEEGRVIEEWDETEGNLAISSRFWELLPTFVPLGAKYYIIEINGSDTVGVLKALL